MALVPTTWNPSDRTATTLSNGNLSTQATASGGVRSVFSVSSGKWYWEMTYTGGASGGFGVANASAVLSTAWTTPTNAAVAYNGSTYVNNVSQAGAGITISTIGTVVGVALDMGAKLIWFRSGAAGNWNNSGTANPATGTGGLNITVLGSPLYALVVQNSTSFQSTTDFGATAFVGTPPSGFTAGFGPDVVATQSVRAMILA